MVRSSFWNLVFNYWGTRPERNGYVRSIIISWIICGNIFSVLLLRTNSWGFNHYIKVVCNLFCIFKTRLKFGIFRTTNFFDPIQNYYSWTNLLAIKMSISLFWSVIVKGFIVSRTYRININVTTQKNVIEAKSPCGGTLVCLSKVFTGIFIKVLI